jgi:hypothetical protein
MGKYKNQLKKDMEKFQILISVSDGIRKVGSFINADDYIILKEFHDVSLADDVIKKLIAEIQEKIKEDG